MSERNAEYIAERLNRYWLAIASFMPEAFADPRNYSIQKTTGAYVMHLLAPSVLDATRPANYSIEAIKAVFEPATELYLNEEFWAKGGQAGTYSSSTGFAQLVRKIKAVLDFTSQDSDDQEEE